ncbi:MAG: RNA recognition motif domain-containing protein [Chloroflexota bacterium]
MLKKLYAGNLPFETTEKQVRELFSPFGEVYSVDMVLDSETNKFRGFCFVEIEEDAAEEAIAALKGQKFNGRSIKVSYARSDKTAPGNHPGSNMHLRTSRGHFGGRDEFGGNGRGKRGKSQKRGQKRGGVRNR